MPTDETENEVLGREADYIHEHREEQTHDEIAACHTCIVNDWT